MATMNQTIHIHCPICGSGSTQIVQVDDGQPETLHRYVHCSEECEEMAREMFDALGAEVKNNVAV